MLACPFGNPDRRKSGTQTRLCWLQQVRRIEKSVSAINTVSTSEDARPKSTEASSLKKNQRDQVRIHQTPGEPLHPLTIRFPFIYKEIQIMQTSFYFFLLTKHQVVLLHLHIPNVHVVLAERRSEVRQLADGTQSHLVLLNLIDPS